MKKLFYPWLRRRFAAQKRSTRGYSPRPLDELRREIEQNHEWAHASVPSVRDSWKRFWLWLWLRRRIRMAPPTPPFMKKVGPRKWVEIGREPKENWPKEFSGGTSGDPDYWKTHEPVFIPRPEEGTVYWPSWENERTVCEIAELEERVNERRNPRE